MFPMTICVQEDIVRFYISVYISQSVYGIYGQNHFHYVELGHVLRQSVLEFAEKRQKVTATVVVHDKVLKSKSREC